jgi:hypothetical protein
MVGSLLPVLHQAAGYGIAKHARERLELGCA